MLKVSNFNKNEQLVTYLRIFIYFDQLWSVSNSFFKKVRIIFDSYFQFNLFLGISLIFVKIMLILCFLTRFYIL